MPEDTPPAEDLSPSHTQELLDHRRAKLNRLRDEFGIDPFGHRVDGLLSLTAARAAYDDAAASADAAFKENPDAGDARAVVKVAGRIVQHRVMGNLIFMSLRDGSGSDLQIAVSKKVVGVEAFNLAKLSELSDLVAARGPLATTKTGEITVWCAPHEQADADRASATPSSGFMLMTKSLALPPGKFHGLQDPEARYRRRYVDLYSNTDVMQTMQTRSQILKATRDFFHDRGFLEVETPMMQPIPGGAAARPFTTHHNALDLELYLRIAPELYLKRLLVGGMPRVFEINRNFRNEGIDRSHNPEFTMLELYEAYGDLYSVLDHTEQLFGHLAAMLNARDGNASADRVRPYGDHMLDYGRFHRATYFGLFETHNGFPGTDVAAVRKKALDRHLEVDNTDPDVLLNEVWEETVERHLIQPTFVIDYPASLCPLTRQKPDDPSLAERFELFVAGMELANAYTELNDPDVQAKNFTAQVTGMDEEESTFRNVDEDFLEALRVGMPPAGGLGIGIDRLVMLMTNQRSIRDVILFPLMRPTES